MGGKSCACNGVVMRHSRLMSTLVFRAFYFINITDRCKFERRALMNSVKHG